ncbi:conserved Plasmodium protein, unknown function [Plasmodium reichenowi]|uniref:Uncharacterized protein n=1 Tax=Plasmodium reichenowi TaxID=5854 RepID=A0A060RNZ7_PLARE|nr:conserved Plasmodium protein, unknown function [Plasmodium reichenowi]
MDHKINIFLYICKKERDVKAKNGIQKKLVPTINKFNKKIIIKYVLYDCKNKTYMIKKKWKVHHILNKTKKKIKKKKKEKKIKNLIYDEMIYNKNNFKNVHKVDNDNVHLSNNILSFNKKDGFPKSSYKILLQAIGKNIKKFRNSTIINTGVDTNKQEKNVFFYGFMFTKYYNKYKRENGLVVEKFNFFKEDKRIKKTCEVLKKYQYFTDTSYKEYKNSVYIDECMRRKKGLIFDIYDYIMRMGYKNIKIYLSSWLYINERVIDLGGNNKIKCKKKKITKKIRRYNKVTFCHRCFIKKTFDYKNLRYPQCCNNLPSKEKIRTKDNLRNSIKRIIKKFIKYINNNILHKRDIFNICFIFQYMILTNEKKKIFVYLINFPFCNIYKDNIFNNNNNEKCLLFLFHKRILKYLKCINDYTTFLFPFNSSKACQEGLNLKKKMISFIKHIKKKSLKNCKREKWKGTKPKKVKLRNMNFYFNMVKKREERKYNYASDNYMNKNNILDEKEKKKNHMIYHKKDIIFHTHMFELFVRLIFENSRTYFTIFINEQTYDNELYKSIYYLNLCKIIDTKIYLKGSAMMVTRVQNSIKNTSKNRKNNRNENNDKDHNNNNNNNILMCEEPNDVIDKLLRQSDIYKNEIQEKDKMLLNLQNDIQKKNKTLEELGEEIQKYKNDNLDNMKIIQSLKYKITRKDIHKNDNSTTEAGQKNNNYLIKLYNENNILKEKLKKLNSSSKQQDNSTKLMIKLEHKKEEENQSNLINSIDKKDDDQMGKINFFMKAFLDAEQKLYIADVVINTQKEIMTKMKKERSNYLENIKAKKIIFKKELEKSLDFIFSLCEDIGSKKEKICITNRMKNLQDCIYDFLREFEGSY